MDDVTSGTFMESVVREHHIYKAIWNPTIGDINEDPCAVTVKSGGTIVAHVPRDFLVRKNWAYTI